MVEAVAAVVAEAEPSKVPTTTIYQSDVEKPPVQKKSHPQKCGIEEVTDERAKQVIDKVIDKVVRVTVSDGRVYLGKLMSVD